MFSWDTNKALANFDKHRVSFEEASTIFMDPNGFETDDTKHSGQECRVKRLGVSALGEILHVVFTTRRTKNGKETIRIISARQSSRKERQVYSRQQA
ncbi:MAG: BrnT family toxin [Ignavibacteriales bacterium]|nr:BrnT family toxin [Ignavibacteriales bacterium]